MQLQTFSSATRLSIEEEKGFLQILREANKKDFHLLSIMWKETEISPPEKSPNLMKSGILQSNLTHYKKFKISTKRAFISVQREQIRVCPNLSALLQS